tara:strand:- start:1966 stop:2421 length:456 start_codon:yes stop_codon:yes gene_type:complete
MKTNLNKVYGNMPKKKTIDLSAVDDLKEYKDFLTNGIEDERLNTALNAAKTFKSDFDKLIDNAREFVDLFDEIGGQFEANRDRDLFVDYQNASRDFEINAKELGVDPLNFIEYNESEEAFQKAVEFEGKVEDMIFDFMEYRDYAKRIIDTL